MGSMTRVRTAEIAASALLAPPVLTASFGCSPPPRPPCNPDPPPGVLGTICGFDRPEDILVLPEANLMVTSGMGEGVGLYALALDDATSAEPQPWRIWPDSEGAEGAGAPNRAEEATHEAIGDPACSEPPDPALFYSHGLGDSPRGLLGPRRIAAVNHGGREAIELFELEGRGREARLRWRGCVELPAEVFGNDVDIAADGTIVVTHMVPRSEGLLFRFYLLASSVGLETGEVLTWQRERGWRAVPGSAGAGPNGLTLSPDDRTIYFADNGRQRVSRLPLSGLPEGESPDVVVLGSNVDNITWTEGGTILAIVHTGGAETLFQDCLLEWALFEIDPKTLEAQELLQHDGGTLCGATSAQRVEDRIYIGTMNETRLGVWSED